MSQSDLGRAIADLVTTSADVLILQIPEGRSAVERLASRITESAESKQWQFAFGLAGSFWRFDLFLLLAPLMTPEELRACLSDIWTDCDGCIWPNRRAAVRYLRMTGYIGDLPQPTEALTLYRGVYFSRHARGVSWSTTIETARYFVRPRGRGRNQGGFIYRTVAPPDAILAGFNDREEREYVVDPALLPARSVRRIEVVQPEAD